MDLTSVDLSCLPKNIDLTNLSFSDEQWYSFDHKQKDAVNALRALRNQERQVNSVENGRNDRHRHDDGSTITSNMPPPVRHVYELNVAPPLPPAPEGNQVSQPSSNDNGGGRSVQSNNAGAAFGRRSRN